MKQTTQDAKVQRMDRVKNGQREEKSVTLSIFQKIIPRQREFML